MKPDVITLGHGSGAALTRDLIRDIFDSNFRLPSYDDAVRIDEGHVLTTDCYVVNPLFFPGGDIGKLSVTGTVNDLSMSGSRPAYLLAGFIIEEGFEITTLKQIVQSMQLAAEEVGIRIIAGDTKVVERGKCDGIYITTTGVGIIHPEIQLTTSNIRPGDRILVNGTIGDHTAAIINARQNLGLKPAPVSDCAPLYEVIQILLKTGKLKFARDATRGGVATILNEIYEETGLGVIIEESALPVKDSTSAISGLLGIDPLYMANEGKLIAYVSPNSGSLLSEIRDNKYGRESTFIGKVSNEVNGVYVRTSIGGLRPLRMLAADQLPRIC